MAKAAFFDVVGVTVDATPITPDPLEQELSYTTTNILNRSNVSGSTLTDALNTLHTGKQNADATLTALAALTITANSLILGLGADSFSVGKLSNAYVADDAAIARTKLASGTASHVLINDGSGVMSSEAQLAISRGGTGADSATANYIFAGPVSGGAAAPSWRAMVAGDLGTTLTPTFAGLTTSADIAMGTHQLTNLGAPTLNAHAATKEYVDNLLDGLDWQESVLDRFDPTAGLPGTPTTGDRYIATATANGWTDKYIYEWDGAAWTEIVPNKGYALTVEDENIEYTFNGSSWVTRASTTNHELLSGLLGGAASEHYHLTSAQHTALTTTVGNLTNVGRMVRVSAAGTIGETDISIGEADGVITRAAGLKLPANVGIGTAVVATQSVTTSVSYTNPSATVIGNSMLIDMVTTSNVTRNETGYSGTIRTAPDTGTTNSGSIKSIDIAAYLNGAGTVSALYGIDLLIGTNATGTGVVTGANGIRLRVNRSGAGATITDFKALSISESGSSTTITNYWGLYEDLGTGAKNYLAHALLIGTTSLVGTETFRNAGSTVLGDISIGAADGVITRASGLQLPANVGIGTAVDTSRNINLSAAFTDTSAARIMFFATGTMTTTTNQTSGLRGMSMAISLAPATGTTNTTTDTTACFYGTAYHDGAGTIPQLNGISLFAGFSSGTGTATDVRAANLICRRNSAGTMTAWKGLSLTESGSTTTVTNYWGLYEDLGTGAKNYLAHALLIGTTAAVGSEIARFAGGTAATPTATDVTIGGGSVRSGARSIFAGVDSSADVKLTTNDSYIYLRGDATTNDSIRLSYQAGSDAVILESRDAGSWVAKHTFGMA